MGGSTKCLATAKPLENEAQAGKDMARFQAGGQQRVMIIQHLGKFLEAGCG